MVEMRPVYSSHVESVGYDRESGDLHVAYAGGKTAVYGGVPDDVAARVVGAPSVGEALHALVRGRYEHRYAAAG